MTQETGSAEDANTSASEESDPFEVLFNVSRREQERNAAAYREVASSPDYPELLRDALRTLQESYTPRKGELVQWRKYLQPRPFPAAGKPGIILEILETPVYGDDQGRPLGFPHDVRVGYLDGRANLRTFLTSSTRLMKWTDQTE